VIELANRISVVVDAATGAAAKSFQKLRQEVAQTEGQFNKLKVGSAGALDMLKSSGLGAAAAIGVVAKGAQASIQAASNLGESMNAVNVSYGESAKAVHELGEESVESFGLSQRAFNEAAVGFTSFAEDVAGEGGNVAGTLDDLMTRSTDFASVMNMDVTDAANAFKSALSGEAEPLKQFGINISDAATNAYALRTGMIEVGETLTDTEKVQARYGLLMEETAKTAGDWANTSDGLAGSQKKLGALIEDLSATFGEELMPAVEDAVGSLTDLLQVAKDIKLLQFVSWIREWINPLTHLANVTSAVRDYRNTTQAAWDYATAIEEQGGSFSKALAEYEAMETSLKESIDTTIKAVDAARTYGEANEDLARSHSLLTNRVEESTTDYNLSLEAAQLATEKFAEGITAATDQGADGFADFSDEAFESIDKFQEELAQSITDTANWKNNLVTIAGQTSGEFATYLASLGPAAAGMIADIAGNSAELQETFDIWTVGAADAGRDMVEEFQAVDAGVQQALNGTASKLNTTGTQIGAALASGIVFGINQGTTGVEKAAADLVDKAAMAAKAKGLIKSPSKLFAEEVGKPISQGVAEGITDDADKVADALVKAIESAEKDAVDAAESLVDAASGGLTDAWGEIDAGRNRADMVEAISDAETNLADAIKDGDPEKIADARERLEDANYRLARATEYMVTQDAASRESWIATATAAGLTADQIAVVIARHEELAVAAKKSLDAQLAAEAETAGQRGIIARFGELVGQGLVSPEQLAWVNSGQNAQEKLAGMSGIISNLNAMFPGAGSGGGGGVNVVVNMPPGSNGEDVVRALHAYARRNGPIQGIT
jgi:hypothetical protein